MEVWVHGVKRCYPKLITMIATLNIVMLDNERGDINSAVSRVVYLIQAEGEEVKIVGQR